MCAFIYIYNMHCAHTYYVNKNFYFGCDESNQIFKILIKTNCISMILKYNFESQFVVSLSPPLFSLCLLDFTLKMVQKTCVENKLFEGYKSVINIAVVLKQQEQM